jgi:predicted membrane channel-forming protein YqfA (hemolysin III family)
VSNDFVRSYKWSVSSIFLSIGSIVALYSILSSLTQSPAWNPHSEMAYVLRGCYGLASVISLILAVFALRNDRRKWMGLIALLFSIFAIFILLTAD